MTSKESSTVISPFDLLPDEIWLKIFAELSVATICHCRVVSKKWYYLSLDESLWQYYSSRLFEPRPLPPRTSSTLNSWESFYRLQMNWQSGTATKAFSFKAHDTKVVALKLKGDILVTGSSDNYIKVWNIKTGKPEKNVKKIDVGADIICVDFMEHKDVIACGSYYGEIACKLFSFSTGKTLGRFVEEQWIGTQCMDMNDEYIVLGTFRGVIHVLLWEDGRKVALFHVHTNKVAGVRLLGGNTVMSVSSNGAIDIFNITTNELLYQYIPSRTSINICSFDNNVDGRDVFCIAPSGEMFHIRWEDLPPSSFSKDDDEDERIRKIYSKEPIMIYQNKDAPYRLYCAGIDSKYDHGVIGSLVSYPAQGHLRIYPRVNSENVNIGIREFNKIMSPELPANHNNVFSVLDIDDERVVAGCTRGLIYCFEFTVDQGGQKEKEEEEEIGRVQNGSKSKLLHFQTTLSFDAIQKDTSLKLKAKCNGIKCSCSDNYNFEPNIELDQEKRQEKIEEEKEEIKQEIPIEKNEEEFNNEEKLIKDLYSY